MMYQRTALTYFSFLGLCFLPLALGTWIWFHETPRERMDVPLPSDIYYKKIRAMIFSQSGMLEYQLHAQGLSLRNQGDMLADYPIVLMRFRTPKNSKYHSLQVRSDQAFLANRSLQFFRAVEMDLDRCSDVMDCHDTIKIRSDQLDYQLDDLSFVATGQVQVQQALQSIDAKKVTGSIHQNQYVFDHAKATAMKPNKRKG